MKKFLTGCLLLLPIFMQAQLKVLGGTAVTIDANTTISLNSPVADSLVILSAANVVNNGIIRLSSLNEIREAKGAPIKGLGFEAYQQVYASPLVNATPGGLGLRLSTQIATDSFQVKRYHQALNNGTVAGISRYYEVESKVASGLGASVFFEYDSTELNAIDPDLLTIYEYQQGGAWSMVSSKQDKYVVQSLVPLSELHTLSLFPFDPSTDIVTVSSSDELVVAPNPTTGTFFIKGKKISHLSIYSEMGQLVKEYDIAGGDLLSFDIGYLPVGVYNLRIEVGELIINKRMLKL